MILLRFQRTFRERAPEWMLAFILWGWGFTLLLPGESFDRPFFRPLALIASEASWGGVTFVVGTVRFVALYINGSRSETPRIRQLCSMVGMLIWSMLLGGAMSVEWHSPAVFVYAGLFGLECVMFAFSGADAARIEKAARGASAHGGV